MFMMLLIIFFHIVRMPQQWKDTFIILLPKKSDPFTLADYRPISLCNTVYKIIAKVLVNRLKVVLPQLISQEQGALVSGRQITTNVLIAQELVHFVVNASRIKSLMMLKLDIEKAYDRIHWSFLFKVLT